MNFIENYLVEEGTRQHPSKLRKQLFRVEKMARLLSCRIVVIFVRIVFRKNSGSVPDWSKMFNNFVWKKTRNVLFVTFGG